MERNYDKEIDALKKQIENIQNTIVPQLDELRTIMIELLPNKPSTEKLKRVHVMHGMHPDSRLSEQMEDLCYKTEEKGVSGLVTYLGVYNSGGRQSNWIRNSVPADELLSLIESGTASKVLACIGNIRDTPQTYDSGVTRREMWFWVYRTGLSSYEASTRSRYNCGR